MADRGPGPADAESDCRSHRGRHELHRRIGGLDGVGHLSMGGWGHSALRRAGLVAHRFPGGRNSSRPARRSQGCKSADDFLSRISLFTVVSSITRRKAGILFMQIAGFCFGLRIPLWTRASNIGEGHMKENGLIQVASRYFFDETVERLQKAFTEKSLQVFAVIDHSGEAAKAGLKMPPTKVIIFGNPKGGTPLMLAAPSLAIDLPLKALVAEAADGKVSVTYNSPEYLQQRHGVPPDLIKNLAGAGVVKTKAVE